MTKRQKDRIDRLMPNGIPRWIRVWDAGPEEDDRFTVCYTGRYRQRGIPKHTPVRDWSWFQYVGMSADPNHICMHGEHQTPIDCPLGFAEQVGRKCRHNPELGRRIKFQDLPEDCQKVVLSDYRELWGLQD